MRRWIISWWKYRRPHPLYEILKFWQRGRRGWADCDIWDFENYLSGILAGGLLQLANDTHGHPCRGTPPEDCENCECATLWDSELRENAERFRLLHEESWEGENWYEEEEKTSREALKWLSEWFRDLWD